MKDTIQKLIDRKIFQVGTLVDAPVKTWQMGQPFYTSKTLRVKEVQELIVNMRNLTPRGYD